MPPAMVHDRLVAALEARMVELRIRRGKLAQKADMSPAQLRRILNEGATVTPVMAGKLEDALALVPGTIRAMQDGLSTDLEALSGGSSKTLGQMLIERGLAQPEDLSRSDDIVDDPVALEIIQAEDLSTEGRNRMLIAYAHMRREIYEAVRQQKRPRE